MSEYDDAPPDDPYAEPKLTPAQVAERHIIGALLLDSSVLTEVQEEVLPSDFSDLRLADIFSGIAGMIAAGEPVDVVTVWDHLAGWDVRGIDFDDLSSWMSDVTTPRSASYYGRMVREGAMVRDMHRVGSSLLEVGKKGTAPTQTGIALQGSMEQLRQIRDRDSSGAMLRPRMLREVLAVDETEDAYDWAVPGLLERRDRLVLTGSEGGGKSTFLRQIAVCSAAGIHPFRFSPIEPVRVLVIDAENSERQWRRAVREMADNAAQIGRVDPRDAVALHCLTEQIDITRPRDLGNVHRMVDEMKPDLLLIGPLYKLVPRSINDDDDAAPVIAALDSLRERNVAMLIEAHAGHGKSFRGVRDLRPRGSAALLGWPEFGLGISRDDEVKNGRVAYSVTKWRGDRDERAWPTKLHRRDSTHPGQIWPWAPTNSL